MIDLIKKAISSYKYELLPYSCDLYGEENAHKIRLDTDASVEKFCDIFNALKEVLGDPVYVHSYYGFVFVKNGKVVAFNAADETDGRTFSDIFLFDKEPSGNNFDYEFFLSLYYNFVQDDSDIILLNDENEFIQAAVLQTVTREYEKQNIPQKYYYYDYHNGHIAREKAGNKACASDRFKFYQDGKWIHNYDLSLSLSDATMNCCGYTVFDYEELTEEEAMRRIAEIDGISSAGHSAV